MSEVQTLTGSRREEADDYRHIVRRIGDEARIIACAGDLQWIVQCPGGTRDGRPIWRSVGFCMTKAGLRRYLPEEAIDGMPEAYPRGALQACEERR